MRLLVRPLSKLRLRCRLAALVPVFVIGAVTGATTAYADISPATRTGQSAPANNSAVRQALADAQKALKAGNVRLAVILLKNAVTDDPKNATVRAELGFVLLQSGDLVSAERELRQARGDGAPDQLVLPALYQTMLARREEQKLLDEFPDPGATKGAGAADLLKARAIALQNLGRAADAAATMDRSLGLRRDIPGLLARARLAEQQNDPTLARTLSDESLKLDPKNADALMLRLGLLLLTNDNAGALALSDQLLKTAPGNMAARLARIEVFIKEKQDAKAKVEVDAILAKSPAAPLALYYKALLMARANDVNGAWRIVQSLPSEFTQSQPTIALMVSQMAVSSGNVETGAAILTAASAKFPDAVELRLRLATIRLQQNSPEAALRALQPMADSGDARTLALLSEIYLKLGRYSDALNILDKLNATGTAGAGAKRERALVEMQAGRADQGLQDLADLAAKQPTDPAIVTPLVAALVQVKRFPEALAAAARLGTDPKQRVQSDFLRGQILIIRGDTSGARAAFDEALRIDPKHIASLYSRAGLLEASQKYSEALKDLQTITAVDPKNVAAFVKMAEIAARQNRDKDARALLAKATNVAPQNPQPRLALVRYLASRGDLKGALNVAGQTVAALPNNPDALTLLGELQLNQGQKSQAVATFRQLSALQTRSANAQLLLADALFASGDRSGAATALNTAASIEPNSGVVRAAQINLLFAQGNTNGAIASARAYRTANPGTAADLLLADTLLRAKQTDEATALLKESYAAKPNVAVMLRLAEQAAMSGDRKKAEKLISDWLAANPRDLQARTQFAALLMQDADNSKAIAQYEQIVQQDPNNVGALNNLGWLLQKDDPKRALALLSTAVNLAPSSPEVLDTFGWIKLQQKDAKGALPLIGRAHELKPKDGEIAYHLVLALDANGNRKGARDLLNELLGSAVTFEDLARARQLQSSWH